MSVAGENPIQERARLQLLKNAWFAGVTIGTEDDGDIEDVIAKAINVVGKGGMAISIQVPIGDNLQPQHGVTNLLNMVQITAAEHPQINRGAGGLKKTAYQAIRKIMEPYRPDNQGGLHHWSPPGLFFGRFELQGYTNGAGVLKPKSGAQTPVILYRAIFECLELLPGA